VVSSLNIWSFCFRDEEIHDLEPETSLQRLVLMVT
jgi:hypothetical protein